MRVLTYNIHKGFTLGNTKLIIDEIRHAIREVDAHVVLLQEVQGEHRGKAAKYDSWPNESQFEFLADEVWPHFAYGKNAMYDQGHHGNAILSKYPIRAWKNIDVSTNPIEQRGILHVQSEREGSTHHFLNMHLGLFEGGRRKQVQDLIHQVGCTIEEGAPVIVGGDFNDWRGVLSEILEDELAVKEVFLEKHGAHARSFPAKFPTLTLDRIYYKNLTLKGVEILRGERWSSLSDHLPLVAEFLTCGTAD